MRGSKDAMVRSQKGGMVHNRFGQTITTNISKSENAMVRSQKGRHGTERVRSLRGRGKRSEEERAGSSPKHPRASETPFPKSYENQRVLRRWSPARIPAFLQGAVATPSESKTRLKKSFEVDKFFLKNFFRASGSPEGAP